MMYMCMTAGTHYYTEYYHYTSIQYVSYTNMVYTIYVYFYST